jgi:hypothetical protein
MKQKAQGMYKIFLSIILLIPMSLLSGNPIHAAEWSFGYSNIIEYDYEKAGSIYAADFNNDNIMDMVGASYGADLDPDIIAVWLGDGAGGWDKYIVDNTYYNPSCVHAADMDQDSDIDVLACSEYDNSIDWWENNGDGTSWTKHTATTSLYAPIWISTGDIDEDGDIDLLGAGTTSGILWFENKKGEAGNWKNSFTAHAVSSTIDPACVIMAYVNGDSDPDIVGSYYNAGGVCWWENDGTPRDGGWTVHTIESGITVPSIDAADIDHYGNIDILGADNTNGKIILWKNVSGNGLSWAPKSVVTGFTGAWAVKSADMDLDGHLDVIGTSITDKEIRCWENTFGDATGFFEYLVEDNFDQPTSLFIANMDGDLDLDICAAADNDYQVAWWENKTFSPFDRIPFSGPVREDKDAGDDFFVIDGNNDSAPDVLIASRSSTNNPISWRYNFDPDEKWSQFTITNDFEGGNSVWAADLDKDGDIDVLATAADADDVAWWENRNKQGEGFVQHTVDANFDLPSDICAADINKDGNPDILASASAGNKITWWENNGSAGGWSAHNIDTTCVNPQQICTADIDRDGDQDVIAAVFWDEKIYWYKNDPTGGALTRYAINASNFTYIVSVAAADMDGDGDPDIIGGSSGNISWFRNAGANQSWTSVSIADSQDKGYDLMPLDMDRDGDMDILCYGWNEGKVHWLENTNGLATAWTLRMIDDDYRMPRAIIAADMDEDGDWDVISSCTYPEADISLWRNKTIHRSAIFPAGSVISTTIENPQWVRTIDIDRNGDLDVVTASYDDHRIGWYKNDGSTPPGFVFYAINNSVTGARTVDVGDIDLDGKQDVVYTAETGSKVQWSKNNNPSAWGHYDVVSSTHMPSDAILADVDKDGLPDVVVGRQISSLDTRYVLDWYENDGTPVDGGWVYHILSTTAADGPVMLSTADLDQDGDMDILAVFEEDDLVRVYLNNGAATPAYALREVATIDNPSGITSSDINRDGYPDIVICTRGISGISPVPGKVVWYENDQTPDNGGWISHVIDTDAEVSASIWAGDLDQDGDPDIMAPYKKSGTIASSAISWYINDGAEDPGFTEAKLVSGDVSAPFFKSIYADDLDRDGDMDVMACTNDDKLTWYENKGGQFALSTSNTAPSTIDNGKADDIFKIEAKHKGRAGDTEVQLTSFHFKIQDNLGNPLSQSALDNLIDYFVLYGDNGNGTFLSQEDPIYESFMVYSIQPDGSLILTLPENDEDFRIAATQSTVYFLTVRLTGWASGAAINQFRIVHVTEQSSAAEDFWHGIPLKLEYAANKNSSIVTATGPVVTPTPTPTTTPTPTATPTATGTPVSADQLIDYLLGKPEGLGQDANMDLIIDVADVIKIILDN